MTRKWPIEFSIEAGFVMALLVAVAVGALLYTSTGGLIDNSAALVRTHGVLTEIDSSLLALAGAPGEESAAHISGLLRRMRPLTAENPAETARLAELERRAAAGQGQALREPAIRLATELSNRERALLSRRVEAWKSNQRFLILGFIALTLLAIGVFVLVYRLFKRDLARRLSSGKKLADSQRRLELVLGADTEVSIISTHLNGVIDVFSIGASRMLGYTPEEAIGKLTLAAFHLDSELESWGRDLSSESLREWTYVRKDGSTLLVNLAVMPIRDSAERDVGFLAIARDITESRRLAQELLRKNEELEAKNRQVQEASRLKSEFLANMSHELRTPLNGIIGFSQLIHDGQAGPVTEAQVEFAQDILASSRHLLHLINDVLDLSKVEAGKTEFRPEPVDTARLIGEVRDIVRPIAAQKRIFIDVEIDAAAAHVVLDPAKLKQVLYNYLSNALKFTPEEGAVSVRVRPEDAEFFRLEVRDTGIGIAAEHIGRLFGEFQQIDTGLGHQGTGLGLALTKRIVEAQGGRVGVQSTPGAGSVFFAVLPLESRVGEPPKPRQPVELAPQDKPALLVIEDSPGDRAYLVRILSEAGYVVDTAASGAEAAARCALRPYSAITLDLLLADTTGWDVLREIRHQGPNQNTPVIVVTVAAEKAISIGFHVQDFLTKPVRSEDLLASLARAGAVPSRGRSVLVVDDDPSTLKLMEATLTRLEYQPVCHLNGEDGLRAASSSPPAAIILDLLMPGMDGLEFLRRLRGTAHGRRIPVIVWTNQDLTAREHAELEELAQGVAFKWDGGTATVLEELRACLDGARVRSTV